jgi:hypothetical protein
MKTWMQSGYFKQSINANFVSAPICGSLLCLALIGGGCGSNNLSKGPAISRLTTSNPTPSSAKPPYVRPSAADNGEPFPTESGPIANYPVEFTDGYSHVTVDNSQNGSDVFVKLVSRDRQPEKPIRVFFIRAGETFTEKQVRAGNYDVRYRDLDSGGLSRTESFNLKEVNTAAGIQYSQLKLTLYKVPGGNMQTSPISEQEF